MNHRDNLTVLWDNDGVLVDTEGMFFEACRDILRSIDVELTLEQFQELSLRRGESSFQLAAARGLSPSDIAKLRAQRDQLYRDRLERSSPAVVDAEQVLSSLHGQVGMGIVTSAQRQHFEAAHRRSGLLRYVDFVLTREDYRLSKPHPEPYLKAMSLHALTPDQCLVVEDSPRGATAAVEAGIDCVVVESRWTRREDFDPAIVIVENLTALKDYIRQRRR